MRKWITQGLHRGDLTSLAKLAENLDITNPPVDTIQRLQGRGFVGRKIRGKYRVTLKGRIALLLREA
jgi:Mn-dependent DtxR family transcriptional regulator